jgi:hypothetical protein
MSAFATIFFFSTKIYVSLSIYNICTPMLSLKRVKFNKNLTLKNKKKKKNPKNLIKR